MNYLVKGLLLSVLSAIILLFAVIGINAKRKIPHKPGKYPIVSLENTLRGKLTPLQSAYNVSYCSINAGINIENRVLKGFVDILLLTNKIIDALQIDLHENLKINKIVFQNRELQFL